MSDSHDRPPNSRSEAPVPPPAMPRSRRSAYLWILGLTVAWAFYLILWGPKPGDPGDLGKPDLRPPLLSITTDYDWDLVELDGSPVRLSNYRGRPLFLNLWATWCGPCILELPAIANLAANPRLEGVAFVCVALDDPESVRSFVAREHLDLPVLIAPDDSSIPPEFGTDAIPATFLIDAKGRIVANELGSAQWDHPEVVDFLEKLAKTDNVTGTDGGPTPRTSTGRNQESHE